MSIRTFALVYGIVFVAVGIAGFVPGLTSAASGPAEPSLQADPIHTHALLFGLFPVNAVHNALHVLFGVAGLAAARTIGMARTYFTVVLVSYGALAVLGAFPQTATLGGIVPIYGHDVWLHAVLAIGAGAALLISRGHHTDTVSHPAPSGSRS